MLLLDFNENPFDLPAAMKQAISQAVMKLPFNLYRSPLKEDFVGALAAYSQVEQDMIMFGNGADELIFLTISAWCGPSGLVVIPDPSFSGYPGLARMAGSPVVLVPSGTDFAFDVEGLAAAIAQGPSPDAQGRGGTMVFLCRPNNPTGHTYPLQDVERLLQVREDALVVVDEAYHEFAGFTVRELVKAYPNLLVMRTMSKAFSLAGIRLGYAFGQRELVRRIDSVRPPYNTPVISYAIGLEALKQADYFLEIVAQLIQWREALGDELAALPGLRPFPSHTNFVLVHVGPRARQLQEALLGLGIRIRHYGEYASLEDYLRISVGAPQDNAAVIQGLRQVLS